MSLLNNLVEINEISNIVTSHEGTFIKQVLGLKPFIKRKINNWDSTILSIPSYIFAYTGFNKAIFPQCSIVGAGAFKNCSVLTAVSLNNCEYINDIAFQNCDELKEIYAPNCKEIGTGAFEKCVQLKSITLPACEIIKYQAFQGCSNLQSIDLPACISIGSYVFSYCYNLETISLPTCKYIDSYAFQNCTKLQSINLPVCEYIGRAFNYCSGLEMANLPVCGYISGTFYECSKLQSVNLPKCSNIGSYTFYRCSNLQSIDLPACISIGSDCFSSCTNLQSINLPVCNFIDYNAFNNCYNLESINLPVCSSISSYAFQNCSNLQSIDLPACISINDSCFYSCTNLQSINLPVCSSIGYRAFYHCSNLQTISLPTCGYIGGYAFQYCRNLSEIYLPDNIICSIANSTIFSYTPFTGYSVSFSGTPHIYIPASLITNYQTAYYWSYFSQYMIADRFRQPSLETIENLLVYLNASQTIKIKGILDVEPTNITVNCDSPNITISNIQAQVFSHIQFDTYTEVEEENVQFTVTCDFADFDSVTVTMNANVVVPPPPTWEVEDLGTPYGFSLNSNNLYQNENGDTSGTTYAICRIKINSVLPTTLYLDCTHHTADRNYAYGLISELDSVLSSSASVDSSGVKHNFKGNTISDVQTFTYEVPEGEHYIYIKFYKNYYSWYTGVTLCFTARFAE